MDQTKPIAALFDFDGVVMDTETQYTIFWNKIGEIYHSEDSILSLGVHYYTVKIK